MVQAYSGIIKRTECRGSREVLSADFLLVFSSYIIARPGHPRKHIGVLHMAL